MQKSKLVKVVFEPDGREVFVPAGTLLSKAAAAAGQSVEMPCGGVGTCGKCKVQVSGVLDEPDAAQRRLLSAQEIASGIRLACHTRIVGDLRVAIPETSRSMVQKILSHGVLRECEVLSDVTKVYCELTPPSLDDERAEFERLAAHLAARDIKLCPSLNVARELSKAMRAANYKLTAVISGDDLIAVESGDTTSKCYGIAYDLGSTTVVGYLLDLNTGSELGVSAVMNPQMIYGDDLIARINFATTQENGANILQAAAVDVFNRIGEALAQASGISLENVYKVTVVGNTCMTHLLLGIDVE